MHPDTAYLPASDSGRLSGFLMPALLAFALLAILYSLPKPAMQVNQPFKAELLLSVFLMAFFALMQRGRTLVLSAPAKVIACTVAAFICWSAVSVFWAASFGGVAHHTLLWAMYLIIFVIFTGKAWPAANLRFIITTFAIAALILGLLCFFDYLSIREFSSAEGNIRIRYGKYAELLVTIAPLLFAAAIYARNRRHMAFILVTALLSWITVMLSLSKGAFLAGIIGFAIFFAASFALSAKILRKRVALFAAIWLAVTIGTQVFFSFFSAVPSTTSYITGAADQTRSTSTMRIFTWSVGRQMTRDNWLVGVGADNFGVAFNKERIRYRETHPNETFAEIAEDYLVERAHNEPLQVLSELGVIGFALFAMPFILAAMYFIKKFLHERLRSSPFLWAAFAGMAAFAVSSQFSSFSFRSAQNGVVFFMVFAVAINQLRKSHVKTTTDHRPVVALSWLAITLMAAFCATKVFAQYHTYMGERSENSSIANSHFQTAVKADPEYAGAYLSHSGLAIRDSDPSTAAQLTRKAIDHGVGSVTVYSQLAKQQVKAGNIAAAEATYREALSIYSRSVYMHMEFAIFLEDQSRPDAAAEHAAIARSIDPRQALGWYLIMREGSVRTFYKSRQDQSITPPAELVPPTAVLQYVDKAPGT
ncbi:MAG: O-antigen ligase family protein [Chloracidobacterium sp.]|nr:O-antigen ligase family protein [Chloracidobacterium sp.]